MPSKFEFSSGESSFPARAAAGGHLLLHLRRASPVSQRMIYDDAAAADITTTRVAFCLVTAFLRWKDCRKPLFLLTFALAFALDARARTNTNRVMVLATSQKRVEGPKSARLSRRFFAVHASPTVSKSKTGAMRK